MVLAIKYIISIGIFIIALSLLGFYLALRPMKLHSHLTPDILGADYQSIELITSDNIRIHGWYIPSKKKDAKKAIIMLHGYPADKGNILPSRLFLNDTYNLLFIDFRYLGKSSGHYSTAGADEVKDVVAAIKYLKNRGINEIGIWGLSMGGAVAIMASSHAPEVKAVVADAPYANLELLANNHYPVPGLDYIFGQLFRLWGKLFIGVDVRNVSPSDAAANTSIPMLITYSKSDRVIPIKHGYIMQDKATRNKHVTINIVDDKQHGESYDYHEESVRKFFANHL